MFEAAYEVEREAEQLAQRTTLYEKPRTRSRGASAFHEMRWRQIFLGSLVC